MDFKTFELLVKSENRARKYVLGFCWKNQQRFCPSCTGRKFFKLADGRRRCQRCRLCYHDFTRRWISQCRLSCAQWLRVVKLFELELSARKVAEQLALAYNTAHKALMVIRKSILVAESIEGLQGEIEMDEAYFGGRRKGKRGRGAGGKVPVFGILERNGQVFVPAMPALTAEAVLGLAVTKVRRGSLVYTDHYKIYDTLMFCGYRHLRIDHTTHFSKGRVYINGLEGFWSWAKERLIKHHGLSPWLFPFYLKELQFRFNHRHLDIFPLIVKSLCNFGPGLE